MKTIHIKGWSDKIDLTESLSDNYDLSASFNFDEESTDIIPNVFFRFYECEEECELDKAIERSLRKEFGDLTLVGQDYGYSEYTIEGFHISSATLGGHELNTIIKSKLGKESKPKYLHILIDQVKR
jgi:hypothetical protein